MDKLLVIFKKSGLDIKDEVKLEEYINFCVNNNEMKTKFKTAYHHILPQSENLPFLVYSNLTDNPWNGVHLSHKNHYIAHSMLHLAINNFYVGSAWHSMNNNKTLIDYQSELIGSKIYEELTIKSNKQNSIRMIK